jgi:integrase
MPAKPEALTALEVKRIQTEGRHPVGTVPGLYLTVRGANLTKAWLLRIVVNGNRRDIGLGGYPGVTLAGAIEKARELRGDVSDGLDPLLKRKADKAAAMTFKDCAEQYIASHKAGWKNVKHGQQWENTLATYVHPTMGALRVKDVKTEHVMRVLQPHWTTKNETMVRIRNRIELVLSWAMAMGYSERGLNPATWRGHLDHTLPKPSKVNNRARHRALAWQALPKFMQALRALGGIAPRCLEFTIITACRSGESRGARWGEIDLAEAVWNIPAERMKAGRPHRVPLSAQALALLKALPRFEGEPLVFPGRKKDAPLSDMSLTAVIRRMGADSEAVPQGFRSTFRDWAAETTNHPNEVCEMALAHAVGSDVEAAYRRGDLLAKRVALMADWGSYATIQAPAVVLEMPRKVG